VAGTDLGTLLRRCGRVVVRSGNRAVALAADQLIAWRTLQIAVGAPYLPELRELRELYPGLRVARGRITLPLGLGDGASALGLCAQAGLRVAGSWIEYKGDGSG
jgi:hypothetical protein